MFFSPNLAFTETKTGYNIGLPLKQNISLDSVLITNANPSPQFNKQLLTTSEVTHLIPLDFNAELNFGNNGESKMSIQTQLIRYGSVADSIELTRNSFIIKKVWTIDTIEPDQAGMIRFVQVNSQTYRIQFVSKYSLFPLFKFQKAQLSYSANTQYITITFTDTPLWKTVEEMTAYFKNNELKFLICNKASSATTINVIEYGDCSEYYNICNQLTYNNIKNCIDSIWLSSNEPVKPTGYLGALRITFKQKNSSYYSSNPKDSISYISHNGKHQINLRGQVDETGMGIGTWIINKKEEE